MSASCRSCGAAVKWAQTAKGRRMPVDLLPVDGGNVALSARGGGSLLAIVNPGPEVPGLRYTAHFVSCPQAAAHRRSG